MERMMAETGETYLFLDKYMIFELSDFRSSKRGPRFAIRGVFPDSFEGRQRLQCSLIDDLEAHMQANYPEVSIDYESLARRSLVALNYLPDDKQELVENLSGGVDRMFVDPEKPEHLSVLDWYNGAIFIPTYD